MGPAVIHGGSRDRNRGWKVQKKKEKGGLAFDHVTHRDLGSSKVSTVPTLRASLSGTFLQTLPDLVTPLKGHSFISAQLSTDAVSYKTSI